MDASAPPRALLRALFEAGVAAADPAAAVTAALQAEPPPLPGPGGRTEVIAIGKAAVGMARAAAAALAGQGRPVAAVLAVTTDAQAEGVADMTALAGDHPVPGAGSLSAAEAVEARAAALGAGDVAVVLISGGASALVCAPAPGLELSDKVALNRLLLASGADIETMNLIRQACSRLKGGGLARALAPARAVALVLSDVIGDDLRAVASGPTLPPLGDRAQAAAALRALGLWDDLTPRLRAHLASPAAASAPVPEVPTRLIGSNRRSVLAMAEAARAAGIEPIVHARPMIGDVAEAAARVLDRGARRPGLHLWGGETTVRLRGDGRGGRNQELALRVALGAAAGAGPGAGWAFLSGGTDGRDGPTDAAGGIVDDGTAGRIAAAGLDAAAALARNDSHAALAAAGDLLVTGPTGTNVADLQVLWSPG